jgi:hypothetical protein
MLIPANFRRSVAYLTVDDVDEKTGLAVRRPAGTVFFVAVPAGDVGISYYAVTARHVVDGSRPYGQLYLRANTKSGGFHDLPCPPQDSWETHPTSDVAAIPLRIDVVDWDIDFLPVGMLAVDGRIEAARVGEGDAIALVGLFTSHPGATRSQPVVRFGHIARMPYEPIPIKMDPAPNAAYVPRRAYLVEATAWGGQSGSPVFIYFGPDRLPWEQDPGDFAARVDPTGNPGIGFGLLGLMHGHYRHMQTIDIDAGGQTAKGKVDQNRGISIVIPAQEILDVLNTVEFVKQREWGAAQVRDSLRPDGDPTAEPR